MIKLYTESLISRVRVSYFGSLLSKLTMKKVRKEIPPFCNYKMKLNQRLGNKSYNTINMFNYKYKLYPRNSCTKFRSNNCVFSGSSAIYVKSFKVCVLLLFVYESITNIHLGIPTYIHSSTHAHILTKLLYLHILLIRWVHRYHTFHVTMKVWKDFIE